jgi:Iron-sulfur cluster-binding domain
VLPCYRAWEAINMGKVYDDDGVPFKDIWNNQMYRDLRQTVNDDSGSKYFPYCSRCEYRYGWSDLAQHIGFEEWSDVVAADLPDAPKEIDHRRDHRASKRMAAKNADKVVRA